MNPSAQYMKRLIESICCLSITTISLIYGTIFPLHIQNKGYQVVGLV